MPLHYQACKHLHHALIAVEVFSRIRFGTMYYRRLPLENCQADRSDSQMPREGLVKFSKIVFSIFIVMGMVSVLPLRAQPTPPQAVNAAKPLNQVQILALLAGGVPTERVAILVKVRGIDFDVMDDFLQQVRQAGADDGLVAAINNAKVIKPVVNASIDPELENRHADERRHMAAGSELARSGNYNLAEVEYRAALKLEPDNPDLMASLMYVLVSQQKWDETVTLGREAVKSDPKNEFALNNLGVALGSTGNLDDATNEFREAIAVRADFAQAHANLGTALAIKGDVDGSIAEFREAIHDEPNFYTAHYNLGKALERKGDNAGALAEYQAAYTLKPDNPEFKANYERLLHPKKKK
jgi:Flp pilus assembly protein TadD